MPPPRLHPWKRAANDNGKPIDRRAARWDRVKRRIVVLATGCFLVTGAGLQILSGHIDSAVVTHVSRSAFIFGLVGLRRVADPDDSANA